jgi:hypothetical protein
VYQSLTVYGLGIRNIKPGFGQTYSCAQNIPRHVLR